jgi:diguanylate cyclase (GGDEF)-like protein
MRATIRKVISLDFGRQSDKRLPPAGAEGEQAKDITGIALLITKDNLSLQWAPRWLQHTGLEVRLASTPEEALDITSAIRPSLLIADAALLAEDRTPLLTTLRKVHGEDVPLFALCNSNADVVLATEVNATDIVRRPYDWDLITRRAIRAVKAHDTLAKLLQARERLDKMNSTVTADQRERAKSAGVDALTRLPNGDRFRSLLHKATAGHDRRADELCLLAIGLDNFRLVNDAVGYEYANRLLGQFADRLRNCLRNKDVIGGTGSNSVTAIAGRLRGARFALLISNGNTEQIMRVNQAIATELEQPFEIAGQSIYLTASIGAAIFPRDSKSADGLLHDAESAMLEAQDSGSGFNFYTNPDDTSSVQVLKLDRMLREAVRRGELRLAYQPITDTQSGKVVAAEALLRWTHEEEGPISPDVFVPIAEKTGLMREIGALVISSACAQLREWIDSGLEPIRIAVNLSLCQILRGDIVAIVEAALRENDLEPSLLELELSERGVLNQRPEVVGEIRRLKAIGVRISIDDFGTGQAAIGYLKDLPIDVIKIDRSYVSGVERTERDEAIASGMVALAQRLNTTVIAEGVETEQQLQMLREWGSQECQGFLFCRPISADEFLARFG